ncbi:hypothetical protein J6590_008650 [Homalodisca vitripennis]|nr:hypothetical protein J6590_008650 [Homalodisca vitripennis]
MWIPLQMRKDVVYAMIIDVMADASQRLDVLEVRRHWPPLTLWKDIFTDAVGTSKQVQCFCWSGKPSNSQRLTRDTIKEWQSDGITNIDRKARTAHSIVTVLIHLHIFQERIMMVQNNEPRGLRSRHV